LDYLDGFKSKSVKIVCDPVLKSTQGYALGDDDLKQVLMQKLLRFVDVFTPNIPEAEMLLGSKITSLADIERAAMRFIHCGAQSVVVKGGHYNHPRCLDYWTDGKQQAWLEQARYSGSYRGTGCAFASALAAALTVESDHVDAVVVANAFVHQSLQKSLKRYLKKPFIPRVSLSDFIPSCPMLLG
jgi:hydroxymethylpyrimidine kinase/phosphomethylpyrimidine kinase